jgi:hypothetical protein
VLPSDFWPSGGAELAQLLADFRPGVGDRRQEIAFLGAGIDAAALAAALDACLCTADEVAAGAGALARADAFAPWPPVRDMIDDGAEGEEGDEDEEASDAASEGPSEEGLSGIQEEDKEAEAEEEEGAAAAPCWVPGRVYELTGGAPELEALVAAVGDMWQQDVAAGGGGGGGGRGLVVLSWHAPWADSSCAAAGELRTLAARFPSVACVEADVSASDANRALALSKVMAKPVSMRKAGQYVLKSGEKWPAATLLAAPDAHAPLRQFEGAAAAGELLAALRQQGAEPGGAPPAAAVMAAQKKAAGKAAGKAGSTAAAAAAAAPAAAAAAAAAPAPQRARPGGVGLLKRGAADLKAHLAAAAGAPVALLWIDSEAAEAAAAAAEGEAAGYEGGSGSGDDDAAGAREAAWVDAFRAAAAAGAGGGGSAAFVLADASASAPNRALARALLRGGAVPALQLYHGNRVVWSLGVDGGAGGAAVGGPAAAAKLTKQLQRLAAAGAVASGAAAEAAPSASGASAQTAAGSGRGGGASASSGAAAVVKPAAKAAAAGKAEAPGTWDPPTGKAAKAGTKKRLGPGKGTAVYVSGAGAGLGGACFTDTACRAAH